MYVIIAKVALALLNFYEIVWQAIQLGLLKGTSILRARAASFRVGGGEGGGGGGLKDKQVKMSQLI